MSDDENSITIFIDSGAGSPADWDVVLQGTLGFNREHAKLAGEPLAVLARDDESKALGGLVGFTQGGWLYVELFWLPEALRAQGLGSELLADAEKEAVRRGCRFAHLDRFTFQAPGFFERHGYEPFGELPDYPEGHRRVFYRKTLEA